MTPESGDESSNPGTDKETVREGQNPNEDTITDPNLEVGRQTGLDSNTNLEKHAKEVEAQSIDKNSNTGNQITVLDGLLTPVTEEGNAETTRLEKVTGLEPSSSSLESSTQEGDDEDFEPIVRKRNKGKITTPNCSLPNVINTRQAYKAGLAKFTPVRNMSKAEMDKISLKDKGSGGEPQSSSNKV